MSKPIRHKSLHALVFEPHGTPDTIDGEWAGVLSIHDTEADAQTELDRIKSVDGVEYEWLGEFLTDCEEAYYNVTSRNLRLTIMDAPYFPEQS